MKTPWTPVAQCKRGWSSGGFRSQTALRRLNLIRFTKFPDEPWFVCWPWPFIVWRDRGPLPMKGGHPRLGRSLDRKRETRTRFDRSGLRSTQHSPVQVLLHLYILQGQGASWTRSHGSPQGFRWWSTEPRCMFKVLRLFIVSRNLFITASGCPGLGICWHLHAWGMLIQVIIYIHVSWLLPICELLYLLSL
jgi:hypothetical protein